MDFQSRADLDSLLSGAVTLLDGGQVRVDDADKVRGEVIDRLAWNAALCSDEAIRVESRRIIRAVAGELGVYPASIHDIYMAMGRGEIGGFTVPAINIRGVTYEVARAVLRAAVKHEVGCLIFEIARSEIGYTNQRPAEYAASLMGAAVKEGFTGPIFIQGDHFQVKAATFKEEPEKELGAIKSLIDEAVAAGFYNIDIDTSTLVDLSFPTLEEQQRLNGQVCAELTAKVRSVEPAGVTISLGGEIGEVGKKNSTVVELEAYMGEYKKALSQKGDLTGISKISVQTGTSHGGIPMPDGSIADVKLDFDVLEKLSTVSRDEFGMSGAVQHGASTLPDELFHKFPEVGTAEIHLATHYQNMIYDNPVFPQDLKTKIYAYLAENFSGERKEGDTDEQFYYKTRKKGLGPHKREVWSLEAGALKQITDTLEDKFEFLFDKLKVKKTADIARKYAPPVG